MHSYRPPSIVKGCAEGYDQAQQACGVFQDHQELVNRAMECIGGSRPVAIKQSPSRSQSDGDASTNPWKPLPYHYCWTVDVPKVISALTRHHGRLPSTAEVVKAAIRTAITNPALCTLVIGDSLSRKNFMEMTKDAFDAILEECESAGIVRNAENKGYVYEVAQRFCISARAGQGATTHPIREARYPDCRGKIESELDESEWESAASSGWQLELMYRRRVPHAESRSRSKTVKIKGVEETSNERGSYDGSSQSSDRTPSSSSHKDNMETGGTRSAFPVLPRAMFGSIDNDGSPTVKKWPVLPRVPLKRRSTDAVAAKSSSTTLGSNKRSMDDFERYISLIKEMESLNDGREKRGLQRLLVPEFSDFW